MLLSLNEPLAESLVLDLPSDDTEPNLPQDGPLIEQIASGDVALLKGEKWHGNEGLGLIHRSPQLASGERRLILTLDWLG